MTDMTYTHETTTAAGHETSYPESTLSLRFDLEGVSVSWTLRGPDASMADRLPRVLSYIKRLQAKLPKPAAPRPVPVPSAPLEEREDYCALHGVAMVPQSNSRGAWWSHQTPAGWCKGRRTRAGEQSA